MKPTEVVRAMITAMGSDPELDKALRVSALAYLDAVEARTDKPKQTKPKKADTEEKGYSPTGKAKAKAGVVSSHPLPFKGEMKVKSIFLRVSAIGLSLVLGFRISAEEEGARGFVVDLKNDVIESCSNSNTLSYFTLNSEFSKINYFSLVFWRINVCKIYLSRTADHSV